MKNQNQNLMNNQNEDQEDQGNHHLKMIHYQKENLEDLQKYNQMIIKI